MNDGKIVFRNAAILTIGRLLSRIAQFFMFIYAARVLGVDNFGIFSFSNNLVYILCIIMDIGISRYSIQQMSRNLENIPVYTGTGLCIKIILVVFGYFLIITTGYLLGKDILTIKSLFILSLAAVFDSFAMSFSAAFDANEKMEYSAGIILISKIILTIVGFIAMFYSNALLTFCWVMTFGSFLQLSITAFWYFKKYKKIIFVKDVFFIKILLKNSIPFSLSSIFITIYYSIDSVMLDFFCGTKVVGYYNAAYRIIDAPLFLSESFKTALFPTISRVYAKKTEELNKIISISCNIALAVGLSIASTTAYLSEKLIYAFYGSEYAPSSAVLPALIFSIAFIMPSTICSTAIRAADKQSICIFVSGFGVVINISLNLVLIPIYSFVGAAWATLITEMIIALIYMEVTRRYITGQIFTVQSVFRSISLAMLLVVFLYFTNTFSLWMQIAGCVVLFLPFALIVRIFTLAELRSVFS